MKLKVLSDIDSHKMWFKPQPVDSDHPTYLVVKLNYTDHWGDNPEFVYHMEVLAVGPDWPSDKILREHFGLLCMQLDEFREFPLEGQIQALVETGLSACLWQKGGNNQRKLIKAAKEEIRKIDMLFGFYMDRPQNAIGSTGWDWIRGEILAGIC